MVDAASGGTLVDKTPEGARNLIANMAANSQQFGTRLDTPSRHVNEVNVSSLEQQLASLTSLVYQMAAGNMQMTKACGICSVAGHPTDMCPTLQEDKQVNGVSSFPEQPQRNYNPYSKTYNPGWRDHPNFSYGNQQARSTRFGRIILSTNGQSKENVSAILLRRGKEVEIPRAAPTSLEQEKDKDVLKEKSVPNDDGVPKRKFPPLSKYKPVPPFSQALVEPRKDEHNHELYKNFHKCEVNIPLLDVIKQVPRYSMFLKELCTLKRKQKLKRCEKINVGKNISAVIQRNLPTKCKDPGMFSVPCTIGNTRFEKAMLDSRASINIMPYSVYASLKLGPLNETGVIIQLADKSNTYPKGVVEDVLMKINDLIFLPDFYVLDMEYSHQTIPILLGRPFLRTSKAKIDFYSGILTIEFDEKINEFNIYDAMKHPDETNPIYSIQVIDNLEQEVLELDENNAVKVAIDKHIEDVN
ncbi:uncharacterized protein LOC111385329 [Olea europaea var. sylvestris]|uniref:uncharacterized protein LOC111385329 n=1 Tax=Olea europaea var. sylvestris TaxID=158386 RepID=UPI000C1D81F8|nr:uncharacterized protein LOC111385329 [Olea europaea var. sylvestris]